MKPEQEDGWEDGEDMEDVESAESSDAVEESPADGSEPQNAMPEGRRVVRKRKKRRKSPRETLYLKKREILREMEYGGEEEPQGPMSVKEQMQRLKEAHKTDAPLEDRWGSSRHRRRGARAILFMILLVAVPLVLVVVFAVVSGRRGTPDDPSLGGTIFNEPDGPRVAYDPTGPEAWFHKNSVEAFDDAIGLLERWNNAKGPDELQDMLRDAALSLPLIRERWADRKSPYFLSDPRSLSWEYGGAGNTGFMAITGRHRDHLPFRAYFVHSGDGLKLDWEASAAYSPMPVSRLVAEAPKQPATVRCWLGKQPDYDVFEGHGSLYSWYQILDPGKVEFVWAYVPAGSKLDLELKGLLNYGLIVMERKDEVRAILQLVKPTLGFRDNEFEVLRVVTEDWVMP